MLKTRTNSISFNSFVDVLVQRAEEQPEQTAYIFLQDGETESDSLTYHALERRARAIAAYLQSLCSPGDRALLLYPSGLEFIVAFFGCLYAGVVAVPAYPPKHNRKMSRLRAIIEDSTPKVALTTRSLLFGVEKGIAEDSDVKGVRCVATDSIPNGSALDWQEPGIYSDTLAFLQYTSGSTGMPKGVMVSHGNILHNEQMIKMALGNTPDSILVNWLPVFHDMGLIGNLLQSFYVGGSCILMSPENFLHKPIRWLQAISCYKATMSGAPNFAYDLCIRKIIPEQWAHLDLSSWEIAFNGAEPVRAETLERFAATFESWGFRREAFYPCYGLAEATLMVTGGEKSELPVFQTFDTARIEQNCAINSLEYDEKTRKLVGCGQNLSDQTLIIADPESLTRCRPDHVGEIWISGPSIAQGYWNRPQETEQTFHAYLLDIGEGPFLRTGDLGFLHKGELFVTGRLKDIIIIHGRNHYPQDIELTVERSHPALRAGCGAAFSVEIAGQEKLIIAQEVERSYLRKLNAHEIIRVIRKAVAEEHDLLEVYAVLLLKTASLPKTSSGKIQRSACQTGFLAGSLKVVARDQPSEMGRESWPQQPQMDKQQETLAKNSNFKQSVRKEIKQPLKQEFSANTLTVENIQDWLAYELADQLAIKPDDIDIQARFDSYGMDSVMATSIAGNGQRFIGLKISPILLWRYPNIESLSHHLAKEFKTSELEVFEI